MSQQAPPPYRPPHTGEPIHTPQQTTTDATGGVIPYKNVPSLIGYYLAVFSLIPILGLLLGPAAVILGIIGFRGYLRKPEKRGHIHAWVAIILGTLTTAGNIFLLLLPFILNN